MILNIIAPDEGTITMLGRPNTDAGTLDRVGYLPEERGLYKKMQVRRVLRFLAELKGVGAREADRRIDEWLERFALRTPEKDWGLAKLEELSRGMQQKVQFIGTLLHDPDLVILDEPFSGLDPINAQALKDTVVDLKQRGKTVIFSTHLMDNAERLCDSVCIIARGEKVLDGTVAGVKAEHGGNNVALSVAGGCRRHRAGAARPPVDRAGGRFQPVLRDRAAEGRRSAGAAAPPDRRRRRRAAVRAGAAVAAPDLPGKSRRQGRRGGDDRTWLSSGW